ncbi:unnamed protein product [Vitrella brassicaformis CCMP3155]|uniref:Cytochrome c assembly protein domain-containing protein n=1 Tax=Vitrella brassicaformis (strain CCMP3155) TaxID=1169540 RepID=A0A0G4FCA5_VITBC|nr:unnamed protein product [Vitrella brassicaformis CCMP3155]|eukprot:CEM10292.1 unnamed protein product [Vitrella brassicaformis CCMP3155]
MKSLHLSVAAVAALVSMVGAFVPPSLRPSRTLSPPRTAPRMQITVDDRPAIKTAAAPRWRVQAPPTTAVDVDVDVGVGVGVEVDTETGVKTGTTTDFVYPVLTTEADAIDLELQEKQALMQYAEGFTSFGNKLLNLGWVIIGLGIFCGGMWAKDAWGAFWSWDPKETSALIVWLIYAAYIHTSIIPSLKGRTQFWTTLMGFFSIWLCYLGINFLQWGMHSYGFIIPE